MSPQSEYITIAEAREILGISRTKMTALINDGVFKVEENPLDKRAKFIRRQDVEALAAQAAKFTANPRAETEE